MRGDRWLKLVVVIAMAVMAQGIAWADCWTCQTCKLDNFNDPPRDYCRPADDEDGWMCCTTTPWGRGSYCALGGDLCYGVVIDDPGGGGGGGGDSCSYENGWCPPECFSCRNAY